MDIASLYEKYSTLAALRVARRDAPHDEPPIAALRELARRFPGALRELERMPLAIVIARRDTLAAVIAGDADEPRWSVAQRLYHDELRDALAGRPRSARGRERLTVWATSRVAEALAIDARTCRELLFPWLATAAP